MAKRSTSSGYLVSHDEPRERPKPTVHVSDKDVPDIKKWEVGKKYKVNATVKMVHHSEGKEYSFDPDSDVHEHRAKLEIHSMKPVADEKK